MRTILVVVLLLLPGNSLAGVREGKEAFNRGDYEVAYKEFLPLAEKGDTRAMITIGSMFHKGKGFDIDFDKAMAWYLMALDKEDGDAFNNIGVMYRDGLGVEKNLYIAYDMFWLVNIFGLGTEDTQYRSNNNIRKLQAVFEAEDEAKAWSYTAKYVVEYVKNRGKETKEITELKYSDKYATVGIMYKNY